MRNIITITVDFFLNQDYRKDEIIFSKARIILFTVILTWFAALFYTTISYTLSFTAGVYIMGISAIAYLCVLALFYCRLPLAVIGNLYIFIGYLSEILVVFFSGGLYSPVLSWLISVPVAALLLINRFWASLWAIFVTVSISLFAILSYFGITRDISYGSQGKYYFFAIVFIGLVFIIFLISLIFQRAKERALQEIVKQKEALVQAMEEVKKLSGLLPICASCKNIRDDEGYWHQVESYISTHSDAELTHGLCPVCAKKLYPDIYSKIMEDRKSL